MSDASLAKSQPRLGTNVKLIYSASAFRTISKDNTSGNDHIRSTSMATLGNKHRGGRRPCQGSIHTSENQSQTIFHVRSTTRASPPPGAKSREKSPWTPVEELRLRQMRDAGNNWAEIAKTFPSRTEESVKRYRYTEMYHAEVAGHDSDPIESTSETREYDKSEAPAFSKPSATPPFNSNLSRPPPAPPAPTQMRQPMTDAQTYGHFGRPPPSAASSVSMPPLKPYTASPPTQPFLDTPPHIAMESPAERPKREFYRQHQRQFSAPHQAQANSPQAHEDASIFANRNPRHETGLYHRKVAGSDTTELPAAEHASVSPRLRRLKSRNNIADKERQSYETVEEAPMESATETKSIYDQLQDEDRDIKNRHLHQHPIAKDRRDPPGRIQSMARSIISGRQISNNSLSPTLTTGTQKYSIPATRTPSTTTRRPRGRRVGPLGTSKRFKPALKRRLNIVCDRCKAKKVSCDHYKLSKLGVAHQALQDATQVESQMAKHGSKEV